MTSDYKRKIEVIQKRMNHLHKRIGEAEKIGRDLSYDKQEFNALKWALERCEKLRLIEETCNQTGP
jgi:hypothetical protein